MDSRCKLLFSDAAKQTTASRGLRSRTSELRPGFQSCFPLHRGYRPLTVLRLARKCTPRCSYIPSLPSEAMPWSSTEDCSRSGRKSVPINPVHSFICALSYVGLGACLMAAVAVHSWTKMSSDSTLPMQGLETTATALAPAAADGTGQSGATRSMRQGSESEARSPSWLHFLDPFNLPSAVLDFLLPTPALEDLGIFIHGESQDPKGTAANSITASIAGTSDHGASSLAADDTLLLEPLLGSQQSASQLTNMELKILAVTLVPALGVLCLLGTAQLLADAMGGAMALWLDPGAQIPNSGLRSRGSKRRLGILMDAPGMSVASLSWPVTPSVVHDALQYGLGLDHYYPVDLDVAARNPTPSGSDADRAVDCNTADVAPNPLDSASQAADVAPVVPELPRTTSASWRVMTGSAGAEEPAATAESVVAGKPVVAAESAVLAESSMAAESAVLVESSMAAESATTADSSAGFLESAFAVSDSGFAAVGSLGSDSASAVLALVDPSTSEVPIDVTGDAELKPCGMLGPAAVGGAELAAPQLNSGEFMSELSALSQDVCDSAQAASDSACATSDSARAMSDLAQVMSDSLQVMPTSSCSLIDLAPVGSAQVPTDSSQADSPSSFETTPKSSADGSVYPGRSVPYSEFLSSASNGAFPFCPISDHPPFPATLSSASTGVFDPSELPEPSDSLNSALDSIEPAPPAVSATLQSREFDELADSYKSSVLTDARSSELIRDPADAPIPDDCDKSSAISPVPVQSHPVPAELTHLGRVQPQPLQSEPLPPKPTQSEFVQSEFVQSQPVQPKSVPVQPQTAHAGPPQPETLQSEHAIPASPWFSGIPMSDDALNVLDSVSPYPPSSQGHFTRISSSPAGFTPVHPTSDFINPPASDFSAVPVSELTNVHASEVIPTSAFTEAPATDTASSPAPDFASAQAAQITNAGDVRNASAPDYSTVLGLDFFDDTEAVTEAVTRAPGNISSTSSDFPPNSDYYISDANSPVSQPRDAPTTGPSCRIPLFGNRLSDRTPYNASRRQSRHSTPMETRNHRDAQTREGNFRGAVTGPGHDRNAQHSRFAASREIQGQSSDTNKQETDRQSLSAFCDTVFANKNLGSQSRATSSARAGNPSHGYPWQRSTLHAQDSPTGLPFTHQQPGNKACAPHTPTFMPGTPKLPSNTPFVRGPFGSGPPKPANSDEHRSSSSSPPHHSVPPWGPFVGVTHSGLPPAMPLNRDPPLLLPSAAVLAAVVETFPRLHGPSMGAATAGWGSGPGRDSNVSSRDIYGYGTDNNSNARDSYSSGSDNPINGRNEYVHGRDNYNNGPHSGRTGGAGEMSAQGTSEGGEAGRGGVGASSHKREERGSREAGGLQRDNVGASVLRDEEQSQAAMGLTRTMDERLLAVFESTGSWTAALALLRQPDMAEYLRHPFVLLYLLERMQPPDAGMPAVEKTHFNEFVEEVLLHLLDVIGFDGSGWGPWMLVPYMEDLNTALQRLAYPVTGRVLTMLVERVLHTCLHHVQHSQDLSKWGEVMTPYEVVCCVVAAGRCRVVLSPKELRAWGSLFLDALHIAHLSLGPQRATEALVAMYQLEIRLDECPGWIGPDRPCQLAHLYRAAVRFAGQAAPSQPLALQLLSCLPRLALANPQVPLPEDVLVEYWKAMRKHAPHMHVEETMDISNLMLGVRKNPSMGRP